ncbi:esterase-like activity of phytase family protein [Rubrimonas cliftonensis]|uniref:Phytase-like domain-containing protein n=1 Tax=Rubrimonas cliftonensis TaxID=89524 RepID=A0A1H4BAE4_9RHOB|nr:esterase-like activity of phytase family protein [Rubrimonas cliftonensis]SEA44812.1 hypothetical protein SAMN05444370_10591 [Rubrimonas cliftonensis]
MRRAGLGALSLAFAAAAAIAAAPAPAPARTAEAPDLLAAAATSPAGAPGEAAGLAPQAAPPPAPRPRRAGAPATAWAAIEVEARPLAWAARGAVGLRVTGAFVLTSDDPRFGGLSGVVVEPDGSGVVFVSDRGLLVKARLNRRDGALAGLVAAEAAQPPGPDGAPRPWGADDAEALTRLPDGALAVAFEGPSRIWRLPGDGAAAGRSVEIDAPPAFAALQRNSGLEALAAGPDGALYAIPERSGALERPFPVHRRAPSGAWSVGALPRAAPFLVTDAAIEPEGRTLYVLERDFALLSGGFSWRVRAADLSDWPMLAPRTVLTVNGGVDNMEGLSVWRDAGGATRLLIVADDNFQPLQRTLLLELALD